MMVDCRSAEMQMEKGMRGSAQSHATGYQRRLVPIAAIEHQNGEPRL
jgi:hypothetical protein